MHPKKRKEDPSFVVHCGDSQFYFQFNRMYQLSYLKKVFRRRIAHVELFPGVVFRDDAGQLWKPEVQVNLIPVEEPEEP